MQSRNQNGYLSFIDINSSNFSLDFKYSISYKQAMERIHALKSDGSVIKDIKVFQEAYSLIGLGWIYKPTKLAILDKCIESIYELWSKHRLKITFRPSIEKLCAESGRELY
ncbi:DCC1-like thiol-disulfide oxidoreductase family protein [Prochlorococcus marinus]|uniref:DCC1-like thiol-disulfide oxidoreductase family protein n=1 Tax=Prochlorococcus marinus TaxID=1219 RepID=UPI0022B52962|nr:DCC1-like thiol-disulfide oxidoreductase family protein [Prochlorococcus marinus]